jgi:hypothetical protein
MELFLSGLGPTGKPPTFKKFNHLDLIPVFGGAYVRRSTPRRRSLTETLNPSKTLLIMA